MSQQELKPIVLNLNCPHCGSNQWKCIDSNSLYGCFDCDYTCHFLFGSPNEDEDDRWGDDYDSEGQY